jgi:hypothetical protein
LLERGDKRGAAALEIHNLSSRITKMRAKFGNCVDW